LIFVNQFTPNSKSVLIRVSMKFFDILNYLIYSVYSVKEKGAASHSATIVGGMQAFNIVSCCMFASTLVQSAFLSSKVLGVLVVLVFQVTTYRRYIHKKNRSIAVLEKMWQEIDNANKVKYRTFGLLYFILSLVVLIAVALYTHEKLD
jgi:hypothetical protein